MDCVYKQNLGLCGSSTSRDSFWFFLLSLQLSNHDEEESSPSICELKALKLFMGKEQKSVFSYPSKEILNKSVNKIKLILMQARLISSSVVEE